MLDIVFGCITLTAWAIGLWYYPDCVDKIGEWCDSENNNQFIIDETTAQFINESFELVSAKIIECDESPSLGTFQQGNIPTAKRLKFE